MKICKGLTTKNFYHSPKVDIFTIMLKVFTKMLMIYMIAL